MSPESPLFLVAQGQQAQHRWRRNLQRSSDTDSGDSVVDWQDGITLGRSQANWNVPWDDRISRKHAKLRLTATGLEVERLTEGRNPIFFHGDKQDRFVVQAGEHFVIGQTTFTVVRQKAKVNREQPFAVTEHAFSQEQLRQTRYRDSTSRLESLSRLPEIIAVSNSDEELCLRIVNLLLNSISSANWVALIATTESASEKPSESKKGSVGTKRLADREIEIMHWDARVLTGHDFNPSGQLIQKTLLTRQSILHLWQQAGGSKAPSAAEKPQGSTYTQSENIDWAFCVPLPQGDTRQWAIYVAGNFDDALRQTASSPESYMAEELQDELKFTELLATTLGSLRLNRLLQQRQQSLRPFFSPVVLNALSQSDPEQVLEPREANVSVLFCDLRGFSKQSEESADRLLELLQRVSSALGVTTNHILRLGGVVGDFHGDAAMGFWGWPLGDPASSVVKACKAALAIRAEFEAASRQPEHPLRDFRVGIGIASGNAVAGRIGTTDQVKVTVFGPVVNLASRLEGITKYVQAPIVIDDATAKMARDLLSPDEARCRRLAHVLPVGLSQPVWIHELLPPQGAECPLSDLDLGRFEQAVDFFHQGKWNDAFRLLHQVPADDEVKDFLTVYIASHSRIAPSDWQGVIRLQSK